MGGKLNMRYLTFIAALLLSTSSAFAATTYQLGVKAANPQLACTDLSDASTLCNSLSAGNQKITSVLDGVANTDAATYGQVLAAISGTQVKSPGQWTTSGNITLSGLGTQANGQWTGSLTAGDRILVKDQTTSADKGIYTAAAGAWTRSTDADTGAEITRASLLILNGSGSPSYAGYTFTETATVTTIGTDPQTWSPTALSGATYTADESTLTLTATQFSEKTGGTTNAKLADMAQATFKMRAAAAGTGAPIDGTATQAKTALAITTSDVSGLATIASTGSASDLAAGTVAAARGGAGTVSGLLKANGAGLVSGATSGSDYAPATSGTDIARGNGAGGFNYYTGTSCTNQFLTALSTAAAGTCTTPTLAGPQFANQGTTATVLHGNASGNPTFGAVALGTEVSGTLLAAQFPALTGDGSTSAGSLAFTLLNIPNDVPMAGDVLATAIAAPSTPASGKGRVYVDSTSKNLAVKDDAGVVKHGVQTKASVSSNFLTAIADNGVVTAAQPAFSDVSGSAACAQLPALTGGVTTGAGSCATTVITNANLTGGVTSVGNATTVVTNANLTGPVTSVGNATTVTANAITNAMAAQMAAHTYKGNNTGSTANAIDLTQAQLTADLNLATTSLQGMMSVNDKIKSTGCNLNADVTTSGTAAFTLLSCQIDGTQVAAGDTFHINVAGVTAAIGNPTWSIAIGTANPGTTVTWTTAAMTSSAGAAGGGFDAICTVKSIGAGGTMTCAGRGFVVALVASSATATAQSINTTGNFFITARVAMSASTFRATGAFIKKM